MVVQVFSAFLSIALVAVANPTTGPAALVMPGHVEAVAASEAGVVAASNHAVRILDTDGYPRRNLGSLATPPTHIRRAPSPDGFTPIPGLTADSDWSDPIDPAELDDPDDPRITDETEVRGWDLDENDQRANDQRANDQRAKVTPSSDGRPHDVLLAAVGVKAWVGRLDGLWRIDLHDEGTKRVLQERRSGGITAVAAAGALEGEIVAVVGGRHLFRSRDGGDTFETVTPLESIPRTLAVTADGTVYLIDDDGLQVAALARSDLEHVALAQPTDVVSCGAEVIALAGGNLFSLARGSEGWRAEPVGVVPAGTERIRCGSESPLWVAYGERLWTSEDRGRSWQERTDVASDAIVSVSISQTAFWVATRSGLWRLPLRASQTAGQSLSPQPTLPTARVPFGVPTQSWRWWTAALPRVDVSFTAARGVSRRDLRALIVLTFFLDRPTPIFGRGARDSAGFRRGGGAVDAARGTPPQALTVAPTDPVTAEERRALAQALED